MHVFQTAGTPPSNGSTIFPIMGWIPNDNAALKKSVVENKSATRFSFRGSERISIALLLDDMGGQEHVNGFPILIYRGIFKCRF
jgi:hypothetical protein